MQNRILLLEVIFIILVFCIWKLGSGIQQSYLANKFVFLTYMRGLTYASPFWWKITELFDDDPVGVGIMKRIKKSSNLDDFIPVSTLGYDYYVVFGLDHAKFILDNSPMLFGVGKLKYNFFKSFMKHNVGVSNGEKWKGLRKHNEYVLDTDKLHRHAQAMQKYVAQIMSRPSQKREDFQNLATKLMSFIVFGETNPIPDLDKCLDIFREANSWSVFRDKEDLISDETSKAYQHILNHYIHNPKNPSLIFLAKHFNLSHELLVDQIPHWIFPIQGVVSTSFPRLITLLWNHPPKLQRVYDEIIGLRSTDAVDIYRLPYLRNCILETFRLNNTVISLFRTLLQDFQFPDNKRTFRKGDQFSILIGYFLRHPKYFPNPNSFVPERWNPQLEKSYASLMWSQGMQRCPGKELTVYLMQVLTYTLFTKFGKPMKALRLANPDRISLINPFSMCFEF